MKQQHQSFTIFTLANKDCTRFLYIDGWFIYQTTDILRDATTFQNIIDARFMLGAAKEHLNNLGLVKIISIHATLTTVREEK